MYGGDRFNDVTWFCDSCNAILNEQPGFSDYEDVWVCTECGHVNPINENEIYDSLEEYQNYAHPRCPECGEELTDQYGYDKSNSEWVCTNCGVHMDRYSDKSEYRPQICDDPECPNCNDSLRWQNGFYTSCTDYICKNCFAKLHRYDEYHDFEVEFLWNPTCPQCYVNLQEQSGFDIDESCWTCEICHSILERDEDTGEYFYTGEDDEEDNESNGEKKEAKKADVPPHVKCQSQRSAYSSNSYTRPPSSNLSSTYSSWQTPKYSSFTYSAKKFFQRLKIVSIITGIIALAIFLLVSGIRFYRNTKISVDFSSKELIGMSEAQAKTLLTRSGFKKIYVEYLYDLDWDSRGKENIVASISIGERTAFDRYTIFHNYNSVYLICHSLKEITINTEGVTKKDYQTVINELKKAGFIDVQEEALNDIKLGWFAKEGRVDKILVDGEKVKKDKKYRIDAEIVVQYHSK